MKNVKLAKIYKSLKKDVKSKRVSECANVLTFKKVKDDDWEGLKLIRALFCKDRLCPMCSKRRSDKFVMQNKKIINALIKEKPTAKFLLLTLTAKNAKDGENLKEEISHMHKSFSKMMKRTKVKNAILGGMRATEVTISKNENPYNQHMHVLCMVNSDYFKTKKYIKQAEWTSLWQESLSVDYTPIVHVQAVKPHKIKAKHEKDLTGAIHEVSKYSLKSSEYLSGSHSANKRHVEALDTGLRGMRAVGYFGSFKTMKQKLNLEDIESDAVDLIGEDENDTAEDIGEYIMFAWSENIKEYGLAQ